MTTANDSVGEPLATRWWTTWNRFWFRPADPSMLGFMRIVAGLLTIYLTLAYSLDLQKFFGPHAWFDTASANAMRDEQPFHVPPLDSWDPQYAVIDVPEEPTARKAVVAFLNRLPDDRNERAKRLRYLYHRVPNTAPPEVWMQAVSFVELLPEDPAERAARLDLLVNLPANPMERDQLIPPLLSELPQKDREDVRSEVEGLLPLLGKGEEKRLVLHWFAELQPLMRSNAARYIQDVLPADPVVRAERIRFLERWNIDKEQAYARGQYNFSPYYHLTSPAAIWATHFAILAVMVLFTIGLFTRVTSVLTWVGALAYIHRSQPVLYGMDTMMNIALFYLMIAPSGAALSVDRLIARYRALRGLARAKPGSPEAQAHEAVLAGPAPSVAANFATRLLQVHFCFIYLASGLAKLKGESWWNMTALWGTMANPEFSPLNYGVYEAVLKALAENRLIVSLLMAGGIVFTFLMEISLPFLIWNKSLRPYLIIGACLLHVGIGVSMGLIVFSLFMMVLLLAYIPPDAVRDRFGRSEGLPRLKLFYNSRQNDQARRAALVRALDVWHQVELRDDAGAQPMRLVLPGGEEHTGYGLVEALARSLRLLKPLALVLAVPGVAALGRARAPDAAALARKAVPGKTVGR